MTRNRYYTLLKERYEQVDWNDRDSIHAYNEFARNLRHQIDEEE